MVQTTRVRDWSEAKLETWGGNYTTQGVNAGFSANPYRMISLKDHFSATALEAKPPTPFGLQIAKIKKLTTTHDNTLPQFLLNDLQNRPLNLVAILDGNPIFLKQYRYLKVFLARVSPGVTLIAQGHPPVRAAFNGSNYTDGNGFAAITIELKNPQDLARGVEYTLVPDSPAGDYRLDISSGAKLVVP
jgi:hypothetical protein